MINIFKKKRPILIHGQLMTTKMALTNYNSSYFIVYKHVGNSLMNLILLTNMSLLNKVIGFIFYFIYLSWSNILSWMFYGITEVPSNGYYLTRHNELPKNCFIFLKGACWRWKFNHVIAMWVSIVRIIGINWTKLDSLSCVL